MRNPVLSCCFGFHEWKVCESVCAVCGDGKMLIFRFLKSFRVLNFLCVILGCLFSVYCCSSWVNLLSSLIIYRNGLTASELRLRFGQAYFGDKHPHVRTTGVQSIIPHPEYQTNVNDIAILQLETKMVYTDYVRPICMHGPHDEYDEVGLNCMVVGWGTDQNHGRLKSFPT